MNTISGLATAEIIERTAVRLWGVAMASVVRYAERPSNDGTEGVWYVLSVKPWPDDEWQVMARRRTRGELLELVERRKTGAA